MAVDYNYYEPDDFTFKFSTPLGHREAILTYDELWTLIDPEQIKFLESPKEDQDKLED